MLKMILLDPVVLALVAVFLVVMGVVSAAAYLFIPSEKETSPTPCTIAVEFVNKEYASHLQEGVLRLSLGRVEALNELVASACVGGE